VGAFAPASLDNVPKLARRGANVRGAASDHRSRAYNPTR
jgi:hypothetical protein